MRSIQTYSLWEAASQMSLSSIPIYHLLWAATHFRPCLKRLSAKPHMATRAASEAPHGSGGAHNRIAVRRNDTVFTMSNSSIEERFDFALNIVKEAGDLALSYFRRLDTLTVKSKGLQDMASEADLNTELLIRDRL